MRNDKMGGPAFPHTITEGLQGGRNFPHDFGVGGMTLWDYYAAAALTGVEASNGNGDSFMDTENAVTIAAERADAILAQRAKRMEANNE